MGQYRKALVQDGKALRRYQEVLGRFEVSRRQSKKGLGTVRGFFSLIVYIFLSKFFSCLSFYVFGTNFVGLERTGDHNTPANKLDFNLHQINKGDKNRGISI